MMKFPTEWEVMKFMFQTTKQLYKDTDQPESNPKREPAMSDFHHPRGPQLWKLAAQGTANANFLSG